MLQHLHMFGVHIKKNNSDWPKMTFVLMTTVAFQEIGKETICHIKVDKLQVVVQKVDLK